MQETAAARKALEHGAVSTADASVDLGAATVRDANRRFARDVAGLIWEYRRYALAIVLVTVLQEVSALWPVALLGQFIDRLATGSVGNTVWLLLGASVLYPAIVRGNVILRHKMYFDTDFQKRVELTMRVRAKEGRVEMEETGAANTRIMQAVSGITNAAYHVLGSFTPVIVKIAVVAAALVAYNRTLGLIYVASLVVPTVLTFVFNRMLRSLQRNGYTLLSRAEGVALRALSERGAAVAVPTAIIAAPRQVHGEHGLVATLRARRNIQFELTWKSQWFLYVREACLVGGQFLVVFIALALRDGINLTPGDFARIIGYTAQVAAAFLGAASCLDSIVSYARAYRVYVEFHGD